MKPGMRNIDIYAILFIYFTLLYIQGTKHCLEILNHLQLLIISFFHTLR